MNFNIQFAVDILSIANEHKSAWVIPVYPRKSININNPNQIVKIVDNNNLICFFSLNKQTVTKITNGSKFSKYNKNKGMTITNYLKLINVSV